MESKKVKAELSLLKSQINPHFFFNTLNNLYGLTVEKSDDAPDVVLKLSEMMRYTIYMGKEDVVPLKEEITFLQNYIDLHKLRYHENIDIQFETTLTKEYQIAPLLFIIALENAFKHGAEKLTKNAYIYLSMKDIEDCLEFTIENNFDKNYKETTPGIGLNNLKERLELLYPKKHLLTIDKFDSVYKLSLKIDLS
jgi:LytS/YehU family sensor histidine kinase